MAKGGIMAAGRSRGASTAARASPKGISTRVGEVSPPCIICGGEKTIPISVTPFSIAPLFDPSLKSELRKPCFHCVSTGLGEVFA